jgi:hypothetical protein
MRNLVEPPPVSRCELCRGELRLKIVEPTDAHFDLDTETLVCGKCGHEQTYVVSHNHYAAHTARKVSSIETG